MAETTPRITAKYLEQFQGRTVRIVGMVIQLRGDAATVDAGGQINVLLNRDTHLEQGHAYEIVGRIMNDLSVKSLAATDFGTNINFTGVDAVVDATHRYKEIFYEAS